MAVIYIYSPETGDIKSMNSSNGLCNNTVSSIIGDDDGDMWAGTYNGVGLVSKEGELITNLHTEDGLVHWEANRFATLKISDGTILMGTIDGLNIIDPKKIKNRVSKNDDLKIYLNSVEYYNPKTRAVQKKDFSLDHLETIVLPASDRNLNLNFSTSNYFKSNNNQYAYRIDKDGSGWVPIGGQHNLNLNNLPAGKYRLFIKGSDDKGNWTKEPLSIEIHAKEFFYKQSWFYVLLLGLMGALIFFMDQPIEYGSEKGHKKN